MTTQTYTTISNHITTPWHMGHAFSQAMPEITHIQGRPLADALHPDTPDTLDAYTDAMEALINTLQPGDIGINSAYMPVNVRDHANVKTYLMDSLAGFYDSQM